MIMIEGSDLVLCLLLMVGVFGLLLAGVFLVRSVLDGRRCVWRAGHWRRNRETGELWRRSAAGCEGGGSGIEPWSDTPGGYLRDGCPYCGREAVVQVVPEDVVDGWEDRERRKERMVAS